MSLLKNIKLITFDVTRTLLSFKIPPGKLYAEFAAHHGVSISNVDEVLEKFQTGYKHMNKVHPNFGLESIGWESWWTKVISESLGSHVRSEATMLSIAQDLIGSYKTGDNWKVNDGCEDILNFLKSKEKTVGVISNFDPRLHGILKDLKLNKYFDFILTSYDVGYIKPDKNIFAEALNASKIDNVTEQDAVHIGDDIQNDYTGAKSAGWRAFLISEKEITSKDVDKSHVFKNLNNLYSFFECNLK